MAYIAMAGCRCSDGAIDGLYGSQQRCLIRVTYVREEVKPAEGEGESPPLVNRLQTRDIGALGRILARAPRSRQASVGGKVLALVDFQMRGNLACMPARGWEVGIRTVLLTRRPFPPPIPIRPLPPPLLPAMLAGLASASAPSESESLIYGNLLEAPFAVNTRHPGLPPLLPLSTTILRIFYAPIVQNADRLTSNDARSRPVWAVGIRTASPAPKF
jgi:hypothetical protein